MKKIFGSEDSYVYIFEESQAYEGTYRQRVFASEKDAMNHAQDCMLDEQTLVWDIVTPDCKRASTSGNNNDIYGVFFYVTEQKVY